MNNLKQIFIKCDCNSHAIELNWDEDLKMLEMAQWHYSSGTDKLSIKERIRWIWRILTTGKPWADHVLLKRKEIDRLKKFLNSL